MLWKVLSKFGCPDGLIAPIREFHDGMNGRELIGNQQTEEFPVNHGTEQGCIMAPNLFALFLTVVFVVLHVRLNKGCVLKNP
jgi:hypothetical protein